MPNRQAAMALLARTPRERLEAAHAALDPAPAAVDVRSPEVGLVMVRGRMGGGGKAFNVGEATVTRSAVRLGSGTVGFAHILGRDLRRARLAAVFDALWQDDPDLVERLLLTPVRKELDDEDGRVAEETAATKVDFFTMVRGE